MCNHDSPDFCWSHIFFSFKLPYRRNWGDHNLKGRPSDSLTRSSFFLNIFTISSSWAKWRKKLDRQKAHYLNLAFKIEPAGFANLHQFAKHVPNFKFKLNHQWERVKKHTTSWCENRTRNAHVRVFFDSRNVWHKSYTSGHCLRVTIFLRVMIMNLYIFV